MARTVRDAKLGSRNARAQLKRATKPYYRQIDHGLHLGYRKGKEAGRWVMRRYLGDGKYEVKTIGTADDKADADGAAVLDFSQAQMAVRAKHAERTRIAKGIDPPLVRYTVSDCMADYYEWHEQNGKSAASTKHRIDKLILPSLGGIVCNELTTKRIQRWMYDMASSPPGTRSRPGAEPQYRDYDETDPEAKRKRRSTTNRTLTVLRAGLNRAWRDKKIVSDDAWRRIKPYKGVDVAKSRYLNRDEITRLVNACSPDFRRLAQGALLTGARYGELAALRVGDYNPDAESIHVRASKSGNTRHIFLTEEGPEFFEQITAGRAGDAAMFVKEDGSSWGASHQRRPMLDACERAGISPPVSIHVLRHSYASHLVMNGVPLGVVADNLGHCDTRMCEKHYAHLAKSYKARIIRERAPDFGIVEATNVERLTVR